MKHFARIRPKSLLFNIWTAHNRIGGVIAGVHFKRLKDGSFESEELLNGEFLIGEGKGHPDIEVFSIGTGAAPSSVSSPASSSALPKAPIALKKSPPPSERG